MKFYGILLACVIGFFISGYFTGVAHVKPSETKHTNDTTTVTEGTHRVTVVKTVEAPSGEKTTTSEVTEDIKVKSKETVKTETVVRSPVVGNGIRLAALAAVSATDPRSVSYGAAISKRIVGPIDVGAFALTNGTFGVSLGIEF